MSKTGDIKTDGSGRSTYCTVNEQQKILEAYGEASSSRSCDGITSPEEDRVPEDFDVNISPSYPS